MKYSSLLRKKLFCLIDEMQSDPKKFVVNPQKDFTRNKYISFKDIIRIVLTFGSNNLKCEMLPYFNYSSKTPSVSAFCQQRNKVLVSAFESLFHSFVNEIPKLNNFHGYQLIACDGSTIATPRKTDDKRFFTAAKRMGNDRTAYLHLNTLYDICNNLYLDVSVEPERIHNEKLALIQMIRNHSGNPNTIYIADRGYESYNVMAHIQSLNQFYLIRIKDFRSGGFACGYPRPDTDEFDELYTRKFTRQAKRRYMKKNDTYTYVSHKYEEDFFTPDHDMYEMSFRILRFPISEGNYECIVTNLPASGFDMDTIKRIYHMRWGIETSYRELKHSSGLLFFHSKKEELIHQEIFAHLTMYNFSHAVLTHMGLLKECSKHKYKPNQTLAIKLCKNSLKNKVLLIDIEAILEKELLPIRQDRSYERRRKPGTSKSLQYRV